MKARLSGLSLKGAELVIFLAITALELARAGRAQMHALAAPR